MYLQFFGLSEAPFSITPDPAFVYLSAAHREALAHLLYGVGQGGSGGFVQLTGEVGTGKTTLCRCLLEQVPEETQVALVLNPLQTPRELLATICEELGVSTEGISDSSKQMVDSLNRYLLEQHANGRRVVVVIDEAQNLSPEALEQVRLLTNLETATQKLLQIILIGQPELRTLLARDEMRQLAQRVTARYHLEPISREETGAYIQHRLQVCGISHSIFRKDAVDAIHQLAGGIPRLINVLCDRSMLGAYAEGESRVDGRIVKKAAREVLADSAADSGGWRRVPLMAAALVLVAGIAGVLYFQPWGRVGISSAMSEEPALAPVAVEPSAERRIEESGGTQVPAAIGMPVIPAPPPVLPETPGPDTPGDMAEPPLPATAPVQPDPSLGALLGMADSSWERAAWKALFAQWSVALPPAVSGDYCEFAAANALHCLHNNGTWDSLRLFDRPAILKLGTVDGRDIPLLLQHLDDGMAEVNVAGSRYRVPVDEIDAYWGGGFVLLLKTPPGGTMYMEMGGRGTDVGWLRGQLETIQGVELASEDPLFFDYGLYKQVLTFQRDHGLATDGIVGRHTIILLNTHSRQPGIPRLLGVTS